PARHRQRPAASQTRRAGVGRPL
ncbi:MAG: hypothetical protein AVDCRST_MAG88-460, partial [uncultured Thermomicrobiales bacterium]